MVSQALQVNGIWKTIDSLYFQILWLSMECFVSLGQNILYYSDQTTDSQTLRFFVMIPVFWIMNFHVDWCHRHRFADDRFGLPELSPTKANGIF